MAGLPRLHSQHFCGEWDWRVAFHFLCGERGRYRDHPPFLLLPVKGPSTGGIWKENCCVRKEMWLWVRAWLWWFQPLPHPCKCLHASLCGPASGRVLVVGEDVEQQDHTDPTSSAVLLLTGAPGKWSTPKSGTWNQKDISHPQRAVNHCLGLCWHSPTNAPVAALHRQPEVICPSSLAACVVAPGTSWKQQLG